MARAVQVEANLPRTIRCLYTLYQMHKKMFERENKGQSRGVQHSQWRHMMANTDLCESHTQHICDSSHRLSDINVSDL